MSLDRDGNDKLSSYSRQHRHGMRVIAFYLTQFHPIAENDEWWGKGFTEWTNVTKAQPLFDGHYQPHLPSDLGFYDLRLRESRREQIRMAKEYGIDGFCYHYYWFSGKRLLEKPLEDMLDDPDSDMPFCLCWANENWTRRWDAAEHEVLIAQKHETDDDEKFIRSVIPFLSDRRYIRVDGKPILIVYRPQNLPNPPRSVATWRRVCRAEGVGEISVGAALTHGNTDYEQFGFDFGVEFPPHNLNCVNRSKHVPFVRPFSGYAVEFRDVAESYLAHSYPRRNVFRSVFPSWDNTARTGSRAVVVLGASPENYRRWLSRSIRKTKEDCPGKERIVFINAWNEWAEGCHLEPDREWGRGFLEATLSAREEQADLSAFDYSPFTEGYSGARRRFLQDLLEVLSFHGHRAYGQLASLLRRLPLARRSLRWLRARLRWLTG